MEPFVAIARVVETEQSHQSKKRIKEADRHPPSEANRWSHRRLLDTIYLFATSFPYIVVRRVPPIPHPTPSTSYAACETDPTPVAQQSPEFPFAVAVILFG